MDDVPVILYRQHEGNAIGLAPSNLVRAIRALRRGPDEFVRRFEAHVAALQRHEHLLPPRARRELNAVVLALGSGPIARASLVCRARLRRQAWLRTCSLHAGYASVEVSWVLQWHGASLSGTVRTWRALFGKSI